MRTQTNRKLPRLGTHTHTPLSKGLFAWSGELPLQLSLSLSLAVWALSKDLKKLNFQFIATNYVRALSRVSEKFYHLTKNINFSLQPQPTCNPNQAGPALYVSIYLSVSLALSLSLPMSLSVCSIWKALSFIASRALLQIQLPSG